MGRNVWQKSKKEYLCAALAYGRTSKSAPEGEYAIQNIEHKYMSVKHTHNASTGAQTHVSGCALKLKLKGNTADVISWRSWFYLVSMSLRVGEDENFDHLPPEVCISVMLCLCTFMIFTELCGV